MTTQHILYIVLRAACIATMAYLAFPLGPARFMGVLALALLYGNV